MKIMKFGGSSVADGERIKNAAMIIQAAAKKDSIAVVLSAVKGATDILVDIANTAAQGDTQYGRALEKLEGRHKTIITGLLSKQGELLLSRVHKMFHELAEVVHGVLLVRECSLRTLDLIMSFGERLNCMIMSAYLCHIGCAAEYVDARELIITNAEYGNARVNYTKSYNQIKQCLKSIDAIPVITGFIAASEEGVTTTMGRNGSDYTASLIAAAVNAESVEIWTDVDGIMSADPRHISDAFVIDELCIEEAMEMSYFGADVIHPYTMIPAIDKGIPLWIKNTMNLQAPGTKISNTAKAHGREITGIASIENVALVSVIGSGLLGVPGLAARVFDALANAGINIIMISQASSQHSICICVRQKQMEITARCLQKELRTEFENRLLDDIEKKSGLEIVAIIGSNMKGKPGIAGKLFYALGRSNINIHAIAQGSSEVNISFVINSTDRKRTLTVVHDAFFRGAASAPQE